MCKSLIYTKIFLFQSRFCSSVCFPPRFHVAWECWEKQRSLHTACGCRLKIQFSLTSFTLLNCTYWKKGRCSVACEISFSLWSKLKDHRVCSNWESDRAEAVRNVISIISSGDFKWSNIWQLSKQFPALAQVPFYENIFEAQLREGVHFQERVSKENCIRTQF